MRDEERDLHVLLDNFYCIFYRWTIPLMAACYTAASTIKVKNVYSILAECNILADVNMA